MTLRQFSQPRESRTTNQADEEQRIILDTEMQDKFAEAFSEVREGALTEVDRQDIEYYQQVDGLSPRQRTAAIQYILSGGTVGKLPQRFASGLTKEEKALTTRDIRQTKRQQRDIIAAASGLATRVRPQRGGTDEERDERRKASSRARGLNTRAFNQVLNALVPGFSATYGIPKDIRKASPEVQAQVSELHETGAVNDLRAALAADALMYLPTAQFNKLVSDVKKQRQGG